MAISEINDKSLAASAVNLATNTVTGVLPAANTVANLSPGNNMIINGAMQVAQRATSTTGVGASAGYFACDRWKVETGNSAGRFTMSQDTSDTPNGFANALKFDCTTADTSIAASEYLIISHRLEGQDVQQLKKGTADAEQITVSFYVKGNASATYVLEMFEQTNLRNNTQAFSVTTEWNRIELTFAADTTGVPANTNTLGWQFNFWLHAGSDYTSGTFASNTWGSQTPANKYAGSKTSFYDSTSRTLSITGVQMEIGTVATPFDHRSYGQELALCQRYYQTINPGVNSIYGAGYQNNSERISQVHRLGVEMRAIPTCVVNGTWTVSGCDQPVFTSFNKNTVSTHVLKTGGAGSAYYYANGTDDFFSMDAEL